LKIKNILGMTTTELNLGRVYTTLKDYDNALLYYNKAVESSNKVLAKPRLQRAYQGLAEVYKLLDNPKEALAYYEKYMEIHTIVVGEENDAKYANLEAKYDLEKTKQESEIHKLKNIELKHANDLIAQQNQYIIEEKIKSERLLLNILPEEVADELKEKGYATPKFYEQTTILFTDFKGFTQKVEQVQPQEIIEDLNTCFLAFDEICETYNLEKNNTIPDAYMAVGGGPIKNKTNAIDAVKAGLAMQTFMQKWRAEKEAKGLPAWELRVGIHTGALIAGVIGKNKFAYDVWGDAVNIAARMESSGEAGKVNVSQNTYELIKDRFECEPRGMVQAKNKGEVEMYFVHKEK
jgi:class 3 adenylate cyclase